MNSRVDHFLFKGAKGLSANIGATEISNQSSATDRIAARFAATAHGFLAGSNCLIRGTVNYNGMHRIHEVDTNIIDAIVNKYVSGETPGGIGAETVAVGVVYDGDWELLGFEIHLDTASATAENLTITRDAEAGAQYDTILHTLAMDTLQNKLEVFANPIQMSGKDAAVFAWANTNNRTWGIRVISRRRS